MKQGWVYKKFSEVFNLQMGKTPSRDNNSYWGGDNVWVSISDLKGKYIGGSKEHITDLGVSSSGITKVPKGTAIMSFKLTIGRAAIAECDLYTNEAIMSFAPLQKDTLLADYNYYYLRGCKWTGANKAVMGQTLNKKTISENIFAYPSIDEQKAICSLLDKMNRVIEAKKEQLKELDNLAQAIFYDMFGDPTINDKGWQMKKLCEVGEIVAGSTPSTNDSDNWDGDVNWVTPAELGKQLFYGSTQRKLTQKGSRGLTLMPVGTVLLSSRAPIGKLAITTEPMCCNQGFKNVICNDCINNIFLYHYLLYTMEKVQALGVGATFKEVSKKAISGYMTILPPLPLQQAFAEKVKAIEQQKELINQSIREVQALFDSRMDYYFGD